VYLAGTKVDNFSTLDASYYFKKRSFNHEVNGIEGDQKETSAASLPDF
jgi:hypothetical protein